MASRDGGDAESRVGATFAGRYFIHQLLARGGMGDVYKATLLGSERPVALKLIAKGSSADPSLARRFAREAAAAARLHHPNVVELLDFGTDADGSPYLVTEFVPGRTLAQVLAEEGPMAPERAVLLLEQVLAALAEAHANGVVHRDLKPANVMIDTLRDPAGFVKVLDFGIARLTEGHDDGDSRLTTDGVVHGTPAYMSPEQIRGDPLDARSDLYSVGVLLFELLTGVLPFEAPTAMGVAAKHLADPAPRPSQRRPGLTLPPALVALIGRLLEKDPSRRPASATELQGALVAAIAAGIEPPRTSRAAGLPPTEALPRAAARARARSPVPRRAAVVAAALVVALLAAALLLRRPGGAREDAVAARSAGVATEAPAPPPAPQPSAREVPPLPRPPSRPARRGVAAPHVAERPAPPAVLLVRGELNSVPTPPAATGDGVLILVATPWAEVSVDGIPLGETPREVRLRAGTYDVRAVHPELGVREERVVVGPGERRLWTASYEP